MIVELMAFLFLFFIVSFMIYVVQIGILFTDLMDGDIQTKNQLFARLVPYYWVRSSVVELFQNIKNLE